MRARELDHRVEVFPDAIEALEIAFDEFLRLGERDLELLRQGVRALSVDRREVDGLGAPAHLLRHFFERHVEDQRGRLSMDVVARLKRMDERRVAGEVRKQTQFDLRIVRGHEQRQSGRGMKPRRMSRPSSRRIGMF